MASFRERFWEAAGHDPFPWQERLYGEFVAGEFRQSCDLPTGLGKTSVIAIWLLALAERAATGSAQDFPRRLIYVVNRRTVVDQATHEAERFREALAKPELGTVAAALRSLGCGGSDSPLGISTLRGEFADNAEWRVDPARPSLLVGTVDMIGSRLLFAGYGCGFKSRPLHAGFLGQDALLVHDEAHLEPAFQKLVKRIEFEQRRCGEFRPFRVMELTATSRSAHSRESILTDTDRQHAEVSKRLTARKGLDFVWTDDSKGIADKIAECALTYREGGKAILLFLRGVEDVEKVRVRLEKEKLPVKPLTGTLRGLERDAMVKSDLFARFMRNTAMVAREGTVYLACTSAGEVGVDISADHLVCDLTPFESMAQRFGRVNRFGNGDARISVVCGRPGDSEEETDPFEESCRRTISLLQRLPKRTDGLYDASPDALNGLPLCDRLSAFTPEPQILPATDILFDAWSMTTILEEFPGRPPVAEWLHGVADWEPPETHVAWRSEVEVITPELLERYPPDDLLEDYPLKPQELLRDRSKRVFQHLEMLAATHGQKAVWIVCGFAAMKVTTLGELVQDGERGIRNRTVLLPPSTGGLRDGMLDGEAKFDEGARYDVADQWLDTDREPRRQRVWDAATRPSGMRLIRTVDLRAEADDGTPEEEGVTARRHWRWYVRPRSADDDGSRVAAQPQELAPHLKSASDFAAVIAKKVGLHEPEATAVIRAAAWHDLGKQRERWQRSIRNSKYPHLVLAKSDGKMWSAELGGYRHEFGSLLDLMKGGARAREFGALAPETQDLVLHLIAAHHGRGRPHFPVVFDPEREQVAADEVALEVPRRFARLQRKYGRWGLAYLESLMRAADARASQTNEDDANVQ